MRNIALVLAGGLILMLPGCIARTALSVATAPVKVVGKAADLATTSQAEADQKRGREIRRREDRLGKLDRAREKLARKCDAGDPQACRKLDEVKAEIETLSPQVPYEPS